MNWLSHYMMHPRGVGRTHDSVMSMKDNPNKVYVCTDENHAKSIRQQYGINTISISRMPEYFRGNNLIPVFDHFTIALHLNNLEYKNEELKKENESIKENLKRVKRLLEQI